MVDVDEEFRGHFENMIAEQGLDDLEALVRVSHIEEFENLPLYSRLHQVSFLRVLPPLEANAVLIRAGVWHMQRVVDYARDHYRGREGGFYCCLSVVDWDQLGVPYGLLTPSITRADATNHKLRSWRVYRQSSVCGALVAKAIESDPSYVVYEGLGLSDIGEMSVQHVYVQASGMALPMGAEVVEPPAPEWW